MTANKTGGASQRRQILFSFVVTTENAYIDVSKTEIRRDLNMGNAHESHPGIFNFPADDVDQFLSKELTDLACPSTHSSDLTGRRRA